MPQNWSPIISPEALVQLKNSSEFILLDARAGLNAEENYKNEHLKGSRYVNLNRDLATADCNPANGGRHPLPSFEKFSEVLSKLGITPKSHVIIYDDKNGSNAASRFWWMLKAIGHEKVQVLNGGFQAAVKIGFPVSSETESFDIAEKYPMDQWKLPLVDIKTVDKARINNENIIIDVRDKDRFDGFTEPLDLIAGHIPGAINVPFSGNLDENGLYLSPEKLAEKYTEILGNIQPDNVIVHCGSGVTACHTLLAMDYAGIPIPQLYVGSWSEWSRNNLPMNTKQ
jgi:thiosulfate/3-mercaptopyruvate sulfurtransferase